MGMFQNIAKQMEEMGDGESDDDEGELTEAEKKEADAMLKGLFGAMGADPSAAGAMPGMPGMPGMAGMPGMPGMGGTGAGQPDFAAQMNQFEEMFKNMGM